MNKTNNPNLTGLSQRLRSEMTPEERHLWYDFLKKLPVNVNRQKTIGNYIVDFYCAAGHLAIEIDGSQHYTEESKKYDIERSDYLNSMGISVLRYSNLEIKSNFYGVCNDILKHIPPHPSAEG